MAVTPAEKFPVRSGGRECKLIALSFTGADGDDPDEDNTVDPCNVVDTITRDAEGSYVIKLLTKYAYLIPCRPNVKSTSDGDVASVDTVTDTTSATNYVYVTCFTGGAADDLDGVEIDVSFFGFA